MLPRGGRRGGRRGDVSPGGGTTTADLRALAAAAGDAEQRRGQAQAGQDGLRVQDDVIAVLLVWFTLSTRAAAAGSQGRPVMGWIAGSEAAEDVGNVKAPDAVATGLVAPTRRRLLAARLRCVGLGAGPVAARRR